MNVTTLVFLGLAVVWAIVLLPEVVRKVAGSRHSDTIRSFNQQLSVLDRSGRGGAGRSNVIDLRSRRAEHDATRAVPAQVPLSVRKRRQEIITALAAAAVLTLLCTVAFGGAFLVLHLLADALLVTYLVLVNQANQASTARAVNPARQSLAGPAWERGNDGLRTATVGRATPATRRVAN
jgi:hypothetical protein